METFKESQKKIICFIKFYEIWKNILENNYSFLELCSSLYLEYEKPTSEGHANEVISNLTEEEHWCLGKHFDEVEKLANIIEEQKFIIQNGKKGLVQNALNFKV